MQTPTQAQDLLGDRSSRPRHLTAEVAPSFNALPFYTAILDTPTRALLVLRPRGLGPSHVVGEKRPRILLPAIAFHGTSVLPEP
jgi:hypothetical protein